MRVSTSQIPAAGPYARWSAFAFLIAILGVLLLFARGSGSAL
jgi:hypothetical protein